MNKKINKTDTIYSKCLFVLHLDNCIWFITIIVLWLCTIQCDATTLFLFIVYNLNNYW